MLPSRSGRSRSASQCLPSSPAPPSTPDRSCRSRAGTTASGQARQSSRLQRPRESTSSRTASPDRATGPASGAPRSRSARRRRAPSRCRSSGPMRRRSSADSVSIACRMKIADWDKLEDKRLAAVRSEIAPRILLLKSESARPLAERMLQAGQLLERLRREGLAELLTEAGPGTSLVSVSLESLCREQAGGLVLSVDPQGGFIEPGTVFRVRAADRDGRSPGSLPLRAEWSAKGAEPVVVTATTDLQGSARLELPSGRGFQEPRRPPCCLDAPGADSPLVAGFHRHRRGVIGQVSLPPLRRRAGILLRLGPGACRPLHRGSPCPRQARHEEGGSPRRP